MSRISSEAMLVYLNVTGWSGRRHDDDASKEVADNHGADVARAGNYNKCLIDPRATTWTAVKRAEDRIRKFHYAHTLPWAKSGAQLLPRAEYFEYAAEMQKLQRDWTHAVDDFLSAYPFLKKSARSELNGLYKEDDYPSEMELRGKFNFSIDYLPVPDAGDWRVRLTEAEEAAIRVNIDRQVEQAVQEATVDLAKRLYEPVRHMASKLGTPGAIFRDSLVENVREMCGLLPRMNLTQDAELARLCKEVNDTLAVYSADALRNVPELRAKAAVQANAIAKKMASYMGVQP